MTKIIPKQPAIVFRNRLLKPSTKKAEPKEIDTKFIRNCAFNNERGDADLFVAIARGEFVYDDDEKKWYRHDKGVWREVKCEMVTIYQDLTFQAYKGLENILDNGNIKKTYRRIQNLRTSKAGLELARGLLMARAVDFDKVDTEINLTNGVFDFKSRTFRVHQPTDRFKIQLLYDYNPDADCPNFNAFLKRIFDSDTDLIEWLQHRIGISLTGLIPYEEFLFGYGTGANGKSVLVGILQMLLGEYCRNISADLLLTKQQSNEDERTKTRFFRARLIIANEVGQHKRIDEAMVKSLTGGKSDKIIARRLFNEQFEFIPTHKLWFFGNYKPNISGTDEAIKRRLKTLPFSVTIPKEERTDKEQLFAMFMAEIAGIFNWACEGYYKRPKEPESVREATDLYFAECDSLGQFLEEQTTKEPESRERLKAIFERFKQWCIDSGNRQIHKTDRELKKAILEKSIHEKLGYEEGKASGGGVIIKGLKIITNQTEAL